MSTRSAILRILADGELHSGSDIGARLGISRAAVCKAIGGLSEAGLRIEAVGGRGYRLDAPLTLLDRRKIAAHFDGASPASAIEILDEIDSTNRYLLQQVGERSDAGGRVCLAESQPAGRGRRGRGWIATPYNNVMLSMSWNFSHGAAALAGLSLAAGVAVLEALERYGVRGAGLKWPNDVLWQGRKLAGLLIDVAGEANGPCAAVLGVGVNGRIAPEDGARIDQPWADLYTITGTIPDRNRLAALLIQELSAMFREFSEKGFAPFRARWEHHHVHAQQAVRVQDGERVFEGIAEGVDDNGALRVRDARGQRRVFHSGEVSLTATQACTS